MENPNEMPANDERHVGAVARSVFRELGLTRECLGGFSGAWSASGPWIEKSSPIDGTRLGRVRSVTADECERMIADACRAFSKWRELPAPKRGEVVRCLGNALREKKSALGRLVTLEAGKIFAEGEGEVQEMIDICDFAVGLSRQLHGLTIASERPGHRMMEQWHPLGPVGVITAFNFPVAVWAWNSALAAVCGDPTVWKPSEKTPFTAIACIQIAEHVCRECEVDPAVFCLAVGGADVGGKLASDHRLPLISATGSTRMGRQVAQLVAARLGRSLLELGGNNAVVVAPSADLDLSVRGILFGAVGTAGQRCTSTRRVVVHQSIRDRLLRALRVAYRQVHVGNPLAPDTLMGPLIDEAAADAMQATLREVRGAGGRVLFGGRRLSGTCYAGGAYVEPCIVEATPGLAPVAQETFAPILYFLTYADLAEAIEIHNAVPQGLSSAIFTADMREAERFLAATGSDCGIANVNLGTSGAEIGGAFGGEKETGGGRESGSDAWKAYMRRQTATINYSSELPLAQGIRFGS